MTRSTRSRLRASQVIAPMVPGAKMNRYVWYGCRSASSRARNTATATPARLSLASDGWQTWQETITSSGTCPGTTCSA